MKNCETFIERIYLLIIKIEDKIMNLRKKKFILAFSELLN